MKKTNSISEIYERRKLIREQQALLEAEIKNSWDELKESIKPQNIMLDTLTSLIVQKTDSVLPNGGLFKNLIVYGLSVVAKKISEKGGEMFSRFFSKAE